MRLLELLQETGREAGMTPGVVAIARTLYHPAITAALFCGRSAEELEGGSAALAYRLTDES